MKKIYLSLLASVFTFQFANAQLTLTKAANEPILGNVSNSQGRDSVNVVPKNTGTNQVWNFTTLITNTTVAQSTYTTVASTPSAAAFAAATIAENQGAGTYNYWKSTATQFEFVGTVDPTTNINMNFSANTAITAIWPVTMGYTNTDAFTGTCSVTGFTGTANGTIKTNATGTGTLQLPSGLTLTNVLQVKVTQTVNLSLQGGLVTATMTSTDWQYFVGTQKFPALTISYQNVQGAFTNYSASISVNSAILTGINENNLLSDYLVYPNPATNKINISLSNNRSENVSAQIFNTVGQLVKSENLGNSTSVQTTIDVSDLAKGVYYVKTTVGGKAELKKVIVE